MRRVTAIVAACLSLLMTSAGALAADKTQFPDVSDTSFVAGNGERTMRLSIVVPASRSSVWQALSTADGWKSWAVATAYVDLREGGQIETNYTAGQPQGLRENIRNQIIAFVPDNLLVFRNVQAPTTFKYPEVFGQIVTSIRLEAVTESQTRVTISGAGYRDTPEFDDLYKRFAWGNSYSLVELRKSFVDGVETEERPAPLLDDKGGR